MTTHKRKKNSRQRGTHTHGWGSKKKHRGAGNRGGRGNAGTGKRGDAKKPRVWASRTFGKQGFKKKNPTIIGRTINIRQLEQSLEKYVSEKRVEEKSGIYHVDLQKLGYGKLLGTGKVTKKLNITVHFATASATEKVKGAGGNVTIAGASHAQEAAVEEA